MSILQENPVIAKINDLKERFKKSDVTDQFIVKEWETQVKTALITDNLQEHEGIKMIISKVEEDVAGINDVLSSAYSKDLSDLDRDRFLDMKEFYRWFLSFFEMARSKIAEINESVDNELAEEDDVV